MSFFFFFLFITFVTISLLGILSNDDETNKQKYLKSTQDNLKELLLKLTQEQKGWLLEYMLARDSGDKEKEQEAFKEFADKFSELEKEIKDFDWNTYKKDLKKEKKVVKKEMEKVEEKEMNSETTKSKSKSFKDML